MAVYKAPMQAASIRIFFLFFCINNILLKFSSVNSTKHCVNTSGVKYVQYSSIMQAIGDSWPVTGKYAHIQLAINLLHIESFGKSSICLAKSFC